VVDGIGNAFYGEMTFTKGEPDKENFSLYKIIRHNDVPKSIDVHFVKNEIAPTGLGEPPFPHVFAALANALYKATGKRYYNQPFIKNSFELSGPTLSTQSTRYQLSWITGFPTN